MMPHHTYRIASGVVILSRAFSLNGISLVGSRHREGPYKSPQRPLRRMRIDIREHQPFHRSVEKK